MTEPSTVTVGPNLPKRLIATVLGVTCMVGSFILISLLTGGLGPITAWACVAAAGQSHQISGENRQEVLQRGGFPAGPQALAAQAIRILSVLLQDRQRQPAEQRGILGRVA